ncbi:MAG: thiamine diphosphokinase [Pseudomonadota bacterium]
MFRPILSSHRPITLVGGGEAKPALVKKAFSRAPTLVAADGGARLALEAGVRPAAVIGDFDSLGALDLPPDILHHQPDQNATDFEKCLAALEAPLFLAVGFLGGRLDHQLAAFSTLLKDHRPIVLLSDTELAFIAPPSITLDLVEESPISVFPLLEARLTTRGLRYPLTDAPVAPDAQTSTSNHVAARPVEIIADRHALLVSLPLAGLDAVLAALGQ